MLSSLVLLAGFGVGVSFRLCVFFQCFSIFSTLCSCVGQALFGRIKIVSVTAFFLMKNVLRHGREKNFLTFIFSLRISNSHISSRKGVHHYNIMIDVST